MYLYRMAGESDNNLERYISEGHTAFVLGYTGESGKALIKDLNRLKLFKKVALIGRREVTLDPSFGPEFVSFHCVMLLLSGEISNPVINIIILYHFLEIRIFTKSVIGTELLLNLISIDYW